MRVVEKKTEKRGRYKDLNTSTWLKERGIRRNKTPGRHNARDWRQGAV